MSLRLSTSLTESVIIEKIESCNVGENQGTQGLNPSTALYTGLAPVSLKVL